MKSVYVVAVCTVCTLMPVSFWPGMYVWSS